MARKLKNRSSAGFNIRSRTEKIILAIFFVLFVAYAITLFYPLIFTGYNSLKSMKNYNTDPFNLPAIADMQWDNYIQIFDEERMSVFIPFAVFNTVWRTLGSVLVGIFFTACTSYVVCKYSDRFKWLDHVYTFVVTIMIVPILGATAAAYEINHNILGIANNPLLWWTTWTSGIGFGFLMQYSAWKSLSWSYAEAAFIDGASNFQVFFKIMMPMVKPILTALFVVNFISGWGEYMETIMYMDEYPSLGYVVYNLQSQAQYFGMPKYYAVIVVSLLPTIAIFIAFQETIMQNMTTGGLKG